MGIADQLGPRPEGKPHDMTTVASKLSHAADLIERAAAPATQLLSADAFRAPARDAIDEGFRRTQSLGRTAAASLKHEAAQLVREAGLLHDQQVAWDRRKKALEDDAHNRAAAERTARDRAAANRGSTR